MLERLLHPLLKKMHLYKKPLAISLVSLFLLLFITYRVTLRQHWQHEKMAEQFFQITAHADYPKNQEMILPFIRKYPSTLYSDVLAFQLAKDFYDKEEKGAAAETLKAVFKRSKSKIMRALAAYRLGIILKEDDKPRDALKYVEKIELNVMSELKAILKAEIFHMIDEKEKAELALQSVLSSARMTQGLPSKASLISTELANQYRHQRMGS